MPYYEDVCRKLGGAPHLPKHETGRSAPEDVIVYCRHIISCGRVDRMNFYIPEARGSNFGPQIGYPECDFLWFYSATQATASIATQTRPR
jgi:hypothetical protein